MARREVVQLRCGSTEKERWQQAAAREGLELSPWIRLVLGRAAGNLLEPGPWASSDPEAKTAEKPRTADGLVDLFPAARPEEESYGDWD